MIQKPCHALIDAGTNTFKLVVFRPEGDPLNSIVYEDEVFVKLWETQAGHITRQKMKEALATLSGMKQEARKLNAVSVTLFCTEAFRTSTNGPTLLKRIEIETTLEPQVLTGRQEAQVLAKAGLYLSHQNFRQNLLTMDIGGGSTEMAVIDPGKNKVFSAESLPLGGSAIFQRLPLSDPLTRVDVIQIRQLVRKKSLCFVKTIRNYQVSTLLGTAGVFESLATLNSFPKTPGELAPEGWAEIPMAAFENILQRAIDSTHQERAKWQGLKPERAPYIAAALVLLDEVISMSNIKRMIYSRYGLKEGLVLESRA